VAVLGGVVLATILTLHGNLGSQYGFDFRGIWRAGGEMLNGRTPYPAPVAGALARTGNPYVLPPLAGLLAISLTHLSFTFAVVITNVVCVVSLVAALRLLGVRDLRVYVIALCSFPFISSLALGQPDGLLALAAALAWRYRDSPLGAIAIAVLIAVKLLAWPLLLWLLFTRRFRMALLAGAGSTVLLLGSWAIIGFHGLGTYSRLLSADARAFQTRSHSVVALIYRLGGSTTTGTICAILVAASIALLIVHRARNRDQAAFLAALTAGLLSSPILWSHYLVILLIPLAITKPRLGPAWILVAALWLSPTEPPKSVIQVALVLGITAAITLAAGTDDRARRTSTRKPARSSSRGPAPAVTRT
jgi:hypothetical protein